MANERDVDGEVLSVLLFLYAIKESRGGKLVRALTKAEKMILKEMYPAGCRVKLEEIISDPESGLKPGDLGTVLGLNNAGGLHIVWDQGKSLALIYGEDCCKCLLKRGQMDRLFDQLFIMPFENIERLKSWLAKKVGKAFPEMCFIADSKGHLWVDLKAGAFQIQDTKISITYETDDKGHLFITKCGWVQEKERQHNARDKTDHKHGI